MQQFIQAIDAGKTWQLQTGGNYFRLVSCPDPVDVKFFKASAEVASAVQMDTGFWLKPSGGFDRVEITSATGQTVKIMIIDGDGGYDHFNVDLTGSAVIAIKQAATVNDIAPVNIGIAATAIVAADATRQGLRLTNAGTVDIFIGSAGVTVANGAVKIAPGQTWVEDDAAPAAWYGIASIAAQSLKIQEVK